MRSFLRALVLGLSLLPASCALEAPDKGAAGGAGNGGTSGAAAEGGSAGNGTAGSSGNSGGSSGGGGTSGGAGGASASGGSSGSAGGSAGSPLGGAGGSAGAAGSAGSGGSGTTFAPCPESGPCKILPLGDSITDGFGTPGGYRIELFRLALEAGKQITFVGGSMNGPDSVDDQPFPRSHEGHSGWTISQIDGIVPQPALNVEPDIILLHIGTNDMFQAQGAPERLGSLLDQIVAGAPDALLVVATIVPYPNAGSAVETYNAAIPPLVQELANEGKHVIVVDQFTDFPAMELADGVHPSPAGYSRMANEWYTAIASYLR